MSCSFRRSFRRRRHRRMVCGFRPAPFAAVVSHGAQTTMPHRGAPRRADVAPASAVAAGPALHPDDGRGRAGLGAAGGPSGSGGFRRSAGPNLRPLIHSALAFRAGPGSPRFRMRLLMETQQGGRGAGSRSASLRLPTLRFRAKVMLGFAVVLAISAASMGIAYFGFERVSAGVAVLPQQRLGSRPGPQHRPRADLVPGAGALLRGDRQGRRCHGGAGGRSQPERAPSTSR